MSNDFKSNNNSRSSTCSNNISFTASNNSNFDNNQNNSNNDKCESKDLNNDFRTCLPAQMIDRSQISIWSILKQFIGKELSKIAMPAAWCEPLSFLQRITENVYYSKLIDKACDQTDPCQRMEHIAAYAVSNISNNLDRLSKPFNPLLGETYELIREDLGFRIVCEQVSHHPPVSAFHVDSTSDCEHKKWRYYGTVYPKIKFWGKSIEVQPKGLLTLELIKHKETYTWQTVTCCIHNLIVGKLWFEYYGTMEILCQETGYKAVLNFKPYSWSNRDLHRVEGHIFDNRKNKIKALYGYWTHCFYSCETKLYDEYNKANRILPTIPIDICLKTKQLNSNNSAKAFSVPLSSINTLRHNHSDSEIDAHYFEENCRLSNEDIKKFNDCEEYRNSLNNLSIKELWLANHMPEHSSQYYNFNHFAMSLNEMKSSFEGVIAPTDSRYRADIRLLENGDLEGASREKTRLEEKQRESRKNRKEEWKPKWFELNKNKYNGDETWLFTNEYWNRDYKTCLNLY